MNCHIIKLAGDVLDSTRQFLEFDKELDKTLAGNAGAVALCLRPEQNAGVELLDWLAVWQKAFAVQGKRLIVVAAHDRHMQDLELSHPDQNISHVASLEELYEKYPLFRPVEAVPQVAPDSIARQEHHAAVLPAREPPPVRPAPAPVPAYNPVPQPRAEDFPQEPPHQQPKSDISISNGQIVQLTGEYCCSGCSSTRMYAKGDRAAPCANPECLRPSSGWKLVFELF